MLATLISALTARRSFTSAFAILALTLFCVQQILKSNVQTDPKTQESRGFGFVNFEHTADASAAIDDQANVQLGDRPIRVQQVRPYPSDNPGSKRCFLMPSLPCTLTATSGATGKGTLPDPRTVPWSSKRPSCDVRQRPPPLSAPPTPRCRPVGSRFRSHEPPWNADTRRPLIAATSACLSIRATCCSHTCARGGRDRYPPPREERLVYRDREERAPRYVSVCPCWNTSCHSR